jgi:hypothetical protein
MSGIHQTKEWQALCRKLRPEFTRSVESGTAVCINCGRVILPHEKWAFGHRMDASIYPEHALAAWNIGTTHHGSKGRLTCNQKAGGRLGAAKTNRARKRKTEGELPEW